MAKYQREDGAVVWVNTHGLPGLTVQGWTTDACATVRMMLRAKGVERLPGLVTVLVPNHYTLEMTAEVVKEALAGRGVRAPCAVALVDVDHIDGQPIVCTLGINHRGDHEDHSHETDGEVVAWGNSWNSK